MNWKVLCLWGATLLLIGCSTSKPLDFPDAEDGEPGLFSGAKGKFEWSLPLPNSETDEKSK